MEVLRVEVVIFNSISGLEYNCFLKTFYMPHCLQLYFQRKRRREALEIVLRRIHTFRFKEELVGIFIGKSP